MTHSKVCTVTTLRGAGNSLDFFVNHHLKIGIDRLFLFLDDPDEPVSPFVRDNPRVVLIPRGDWLRTIWAKQSLYPSLRDFTSREVMARQMLNAQVAIRLAPGYGLEWIVHLDLDELLYPENLDLAAYFGGLGEAGVDVVRFWNHEGVAASLHGGDGFGNVRLFKQNAATLSRESRALLPAGFGQRPYFNFYSNGKSAARLHKGLVPNGVHDFAPKRRPADAANPCILHYACPSFGQFWDKYQALGDFAPRWFDRVPIADSVPTHLASRDVCRSGDLPAARAFYRERFMLEDPALTARLIAGNVLRPLSPDPL